MILLFQSKIFEVFKLLLCGAVRTPFFIDEILGKSFRKLVIGLVSLILKAIRM